MRGMMMWLLSILQRKEQHQIEGDTKEKATTATTKIEGEKEDDGGRNWLDSEVHTLIALRGEMQPEFVRHGKKQGTISSPLPFCLGLSPVPGPQAPLSLHIPHMM